MKFVLWIVQRIISLRYRLDVKGIKTLESSRFNPEKGILFLPNHPSEMDPVILLSLLWEKFHPRPLVVDHFYELKQLRYFMKKVRALPLPSMSSSNNKRKIKQVEKLLSLLAEELNHKQNLLIYPAGRLKLTGSEILGGASLVHALIQMCPGVNIVLVRTTGLWGSRFSRALSGSFPPFAKTFFDCLMILLKNGIFFAPKRNLTVEFEVAPSDFPVQASRQEMNQYLENWYNRYPVPGPEPLKLVSEYFWKNKLPDVQTRNHLNQSQKEVVVPEAIQKEIFSEIAKITKKPVEQIRADMHLSFDLGLDSLDVSELYIFMEERMHVHRLRYGELQTVQDLLKAAAGVDVAGEEAKLEEAPRRWTIDSDRRPEPFTSRGNTIFEAFLLATDTMNKWIACADATSGILSYKKMKMAALILSRKIKQFPGDYIGILLPSSVGINIAILATMLAGKKPVMLNWTGGVKFLDHALELTGMEHVLTANRFLDRLETCDLGKIEDRLVLMEDIKQKLTFKEKLHGFLLSLRKTKGILKRLDLEHVSEEDTAVVLFTSGTEALPKGVPLSHKNILSNQRSAASKVYFGPKDIMFGVLPPFHSFGFSVTGLFPLVSGLKVFYAADPTDNQAMAKAIFKWKPTLFCCAPSFIRNLFKAARKEDLSSIRLFVAGAEKTPPELFEYVKNLGPGHELIEGYGITECGPIVSINLPEMPARGLGKPIPGVEVRICNRENLSTCQIGEDGEIFIHGPNIFKGYLGTVQSPFVTLDSKAWYQSGDRGHLDEEGYLFLSGRYKRFVKIAGEMISLGGLEEDILEFVKDRHLMPIESGLPILAVSSVEKGLPRPLIVLYITFPVNLDEVNVFLRRKGYTNLVKISEVRMRDAIPLTSTGKISYSALDA